MKRLIELYHKDPLLGGHCGQRRLLNKLRATYKWKKMSKQVAQYVKNCIDCAKNKPSFKGKEPMTITPTPQKAFDIVIIDTIGPFPATAAGNKYAVTLECDLTKYLVPIPIENKEAKTVARAIFNHFVLIYGAPKEIRTDLGSEFKNATVKELTELLGIRHSFSTAYHHETVGTVERNHRVFNEYLRTYATQGDKEWDEWLLYFAYCWNTTPSALVKDYSPFELVFGKKSNLPTYSEIEPVYNIDNYVNELKYRLQVAQENAKILLEKEKVKRKSNYDKNCKPIKLQIGDKVLVKNEEGHKHESLYKGPFTVVSIDNTNSTLSDSLGRMIVVHNNRIKLY